jgi:hypothetical protein
MFELSKSEGATIYADRFGHSEHTPGPWTVWQLAPDSDPHERHIVVAGEDYGIEVCGIVGNVLDAELIAAAPEMLEALRAVREWLGRRAGSAGLQDAPIEQIEAAIRAVQRR